MRILFRSFLEEKVDPYRALNAFIVSTLNAVGEETPQIRDRVDSL